MIFHKMIEICLKDDNMHGFVMINALICINIYVITCINSMLSTTPYTPQQNGVVETKNRTIVGLIRSMLKDKSLPIELWGE